MKTKNVILCSALLFTVPLSAQTKSDNSKVNRRDRSANEMTADQHTANATDTDISSRIRQELMKEANLSTYAQNIKIIAVNGRVTIKGPVRTHKEKDKVLRHARSIAGAANVRDEVSVAAIK